MDQRSTNATKPHRAASPGATWVWRLGREAGSGKCSTHGPSLDRALTAAGYEPLRAEQAERRAGGDPVQLGIGIPAVYDAVVDALVHLGVRHVTMPCTPERIWAAITAARPGLAVASEPWGSSHIPSSARSSSVRTTCVPG